MEYDFLNKFQKVIIKECIEKGTGGLSLPMGSGKTVISLVLSQILKETQEPIKSKGSLVVASKTLVQSWVSEIEKFLPDMKYHVFHTDYSKKNKFTVNESEIIITTPETISKYFELYDVSHHSEEYRKISTYGHLETITKYYCKSNGFFLKKSSGEYKNILVSKIDKTGLFLYNKQWNSLFIDEVQNHTNIKSKKTRALVAVSAKHRWLLSGTILSEPTNERVFGYFLLLNHQTFPRTLPTATEYIKSKNFKGIGETLVKRNSNEGMETPINLIQKIITHDLTDQEAFIYTSIKTIMNEFQSRSERYKLQGNSQLMRKFSAYQMALLMYLRQMLVCPLAPLCSAIVDSLDYGENNIMAKTMVREINDKIDINYLNDTNNVLSTRIKKVIETVNIHPNEKLILFTCFRTSVDILVHFLPNNRRSFTISGKDSISKRTEIINEFKETENGILVLTYDIGAEGLNLQFASIVLLVDFFWNDGKTSQAIARVLRYGQQSKNVHVYLFTSNTGIENIIFKKQKDKIKIIDLLQIGGTGNTKVSKLNMKDVIKMINIEDLKTNLSEVRKIK